MHGQQNIKKNRHDETNCTNLVSERRHIYKPHTICCRTTLVYNVDEFWTIIDGDCANKSAVDRIFCVPRIQEDSCLCQL